MKETVKWKRIHLLEDKQKDVTDKIGESLDAMRASSDYLIARKENTEAYQKELLYRLLGPVFFGEKAAGNLEELVSLFQEKYGIDVRKDFCEGDEHYEEYQEASKAIAEGLSIYGGSIVFEDGMLAELAEQVWDGMEKQQKDEFRRINTMLEE